MNYNRSWLSILLSWLGLDFAWFANKVDLRTGKTSSPIWSLRASMIFVARFCALISCGGEGSYETTIATVPAFTSLLLEQCKIRLTEMKNYTLMANSNQTSAVAFYDIVHKKAQKAQGWISCTSSIHIRGNSVMLLFDMSWEWSRRTLPSSFPKLSSSANVSTFILPSNAFLSSPLSSDASALARRKYVLPFFNSL